MKTIRALLSLFLTLALPLSGAQQVITPGASITLAEGRDMINANFAELYAADLTLQPLDSDLTALAALTTTTFGRSLLTNADAAALRTAIGLGAADAPTFAGATFTGDSALQITGGITLLGATSGSALLSAPDTGSGTFKLRSTSGDYIVLDDGSTISGSQITGGTFGAVNASALTALTAANITASTTAGRALLNVTNPSAISFPKFAADNTVSTRTPAQVLSDIGADNAANLTSGTLAAARGGTGVSNAGTITNASNTTITGGGTVALGGFTLTVPASGTAALLGTANTFTATQTVSGANVSLSVVNTGASNASTNVSAFSGGTTGALINGASYIQAGANSTELILSTTGAQPLVLCTDNWTERLRISPTTGLVTVANALAATPATRSGAGAVPLTAVNVALTTTAGAQALTLADGTNGQELTILHDVDGGSAVLTPSTKTGFSTVTFTNAGETVTLKFLTTRGWFITGSYGVTIAP